MLYDLNEFVILFSQSNETLQSELNYLLVKQCNHSDHSDHPLSWGQELTYWTHILGSLSYIFVQLWTPKMYSFIFTVGPDGVVCISILHEPGDDKYGYETASERWLPVHTVETILVSVISMISDPNDESPANVDAAVSFFFNLRVIMMSVL